MYKLLAATASVVLGAAGLAADDIFAPPWEGQAGSAAADWWTWGLQPDGSVGTYNPDNWEGNPLPAQTPEYGTVGARGTEWDLLALFAGRIDVFRLDRDQALGFRVRPDAANWRNCRVQITYYVGDHPEAEVRPTPALAFAWAYQFVHTSLADRLDDGTWRTDAWDIRMDLDLYWQWLSLSASYGGGPAPGAYPAYVDQVAIDVIIPEPTSLCLLALGGLCAVVRRRR